MTPPFPQADRGRNSAIKESEREHTKRAKERTKGAVMSTVEGRERGQTDAAEEMPPAPKRQRHDSDSHSDPDDCPVDPSSLIVQARLRSGEIELGAGPTLSPSPLKTTQRQWDGRRTDVRLLMRNLHETT